MRRFFRPTNAFSEKIENLTHMLSLYFVLHNFIRFHKSLGTTPAIAAGVADVVHDFEWMVDMIDAHAPKPNSSKTYR